jgi:hypothetical protein
MSTTSTNVPTEEKDDKMTANGVNHSQKKEDQADIPSLCGSNGAVHKHNHPEQEKDEGETQETSPP